MAGSRMTRRSPRPRHSRHAVRVAAAAALLLAACHHKRAAPATPPTPDEHATHESVAAHVGSSTEAAAAVAAGTGPAATSGGAGTGTSTSAGTSAGASGSMAGMDMGTSASGTPNASGALGAMNLPADANSAQARIDASPRHGEWAMIPTGGVGGTDSLRAWVVYPERRDKAPVVVVIHEIFGLTTWVRAVADQLAAEGFIAVAPDLLSGKRPPGYLDAQPQDSAVALIRTLRPEDVQAHLDATARWGMALPAALPKYGVVGFCWGGTASFAHAVHSPSLGAAVVYYGTSPATPSLAAVRAPVLGLYAGDDARVLATVPAADSAMRALGKPYRTMTFEGAGHGFLRQQDGRDGANLRATQAAWPATIAFFKENLR